MGVECLEDRRLLALGDLDPNFGADFNGDGFPDGWLVGDFGGDDTAAAVAIQNDNGVEKILVAGTVDGDFLVARYNPDGSLDTTFGVGGYVTTDFGGGSQDTAADVLVQPDGKIVVAGNTMAAGDWNFAVARYLPSGAPDPGFGAGGNAIAVDFGYQFEQADAVAYLPDGRIVLAGNSGPFVDGTWRTSFALAALDPSGNLDTTFGTQGKVFTTFPEGTAGATDVAIDFSTGKIVAVGILQPDGLYETEFAAARYDASGALDATFDGDGRTVLSFGLHQNQAMAVEVLTNGRLLLGGIASRDFAVVRTNQDGSLDSTFGVGGVASIDFNGGSDALFDMVRQSDGKIIVVGTTYPPRDPGIPFSNYNFVLARLNEDGTLNGSFGTAGQVTTDLGLTLDNAYSVALQSDGGIVVAGTRQTRNAEPPDEFEIAVARYVGDAGPPGPPGALDSDLDGVPDEEEDGVDGDGDGLPDGDGNQNGTPDRTESRVASFWTSPGGGLGVGAYVTLELHGTDPSGSPLPPDARLSRVKGFALPQADLPLPPPDDPMYPPPRMAPLPADLSPASGGFRLDVVGLTPGGSIGLNLYDHGSGFNPQLSEVFGFSRTGDHHAPHWFHFRTGIFAGVGAELAPPTGSAGPAPAGASLRAAQPAGGVMIITLVDGGFAGDDDGLANGQITFTGAHVLAGPTSNLDQGSIVAQVFHDIDGDGRRDSQWDQVPYPAHEPGIAGVTVWLDYDHDGQYTPGADREAITDEDGYVFFDGLPRVSYTIGELAPNGWRQTAPAPWGPSAVLSAPRLRAPGSAVMAKLVGSDDYVDLAAAQRGGYFVTVFPGRGDGTFGEQDAKSIHAQVGGMSSIASGDVDGDGLTDLVAVGFLGVSLLIQDPLAESGFGVYHLDLGPDFRGSYVLVGDLLNRPPWANPRLADLVVVTTVADLSTGAGVVPVIQQAPGIFTVGATYLSGTRPGRPALADLDGDGDLDLAVPQGPAGQPGSLTVLRNQGGGTFLPDFPIPVGDLPGTATAADLDGDGDFDLVVANRATNDVSVLRNSASGFSAGTRYAVGRSPRDVVVLDVDGDQLPDIVTADLPDDQLSVLAGLGDGRFDSAFAIPGVPSPLALALGDKDGDGQSDLLAVVNHASDQISVLAPGPQTYIVALGSDPSITGADFGNRIKGGATIRGVTFHDLNGNGAYDSGEPFLPDVRVGVDVDGPDPDGYVTYEAVTSSSADGTYAFPNLVPGQYNVGASYYFILPGGIYPGFDLSSPGGDGFWHVELSPGAVNRLDFGFQRLSSIRGVLWNDDGAGVLEDAADGVRQAGEALLPNWQVFLDANGNGVFDSAEEATRWTYGRGEYEFFLIKPGTYQVLPVLNVLAGWAASAVPPPMVLDYEQQVTGVEIGVHAPPGRIRGRVWDDVDGDGLFGAGEAGRAGAVVYLDQNRNGSRDAGETVRTTDSQGFYAFEDLPAGITYIVTPQIEPGRWQSFPMLGGGSPLVYEVALGPRETAADRDFATAPGGGEIRGTKWIDVNGDGLKQVTEPPVPNATIFADLNRNSVHDPDEPSAVTDAAGLYVMQLPPGEHLIVDPTWAQQYAASRLGGEPVEFGYSLAVVGDDILVGDPRAKHDVTVLREGGAGCGDLAVLLLGCRSREDDPTPARFHELWEVGAASRIDVDNGNTLSSLWPYDLWEHDARLPQALASSNRKVYAARFGAAVAEWKGEPAVSAPVYGFFKSAVFTYSGGRRRYLLEDGYGPETGNPMAATPELLAVLGDYRLVLVNGQEPLPTSGDLFSPSASLAKSDLPSPADGLYWVRDDILLAFGPKAALFGDKFLVGEPDRDGGSVSGAGAVSLYDAATGQLLLTIDNPTPAPGDDFGHAVAVLGNRIFISDPLDDTFGPNAGAVYEFDADQGSLVRTLFSLEPGAGAKFGFSLATKGPDQIFVGSPYPGSTANSGEVYRFRLRDPVTLAAGEVRQLDFPSHPSSADFDEDGVGGDIEDLAPNHGDGNNDGVPDRLQEHVVSLPNAVDGSYVTLEVVSPAGAKLVDVSAVDMASAGLILSRTNFGVGHFDFAVEGISPGAAVEVRMTVHSGQTPDAYYKLQEEGRLQFWRPFDFDGTTGAEIDGNTITLHLLDGGRGDSDATPGRIHDPGGPAYVGNTPPVIGRAEWETVAADSGLAIRLRASFTDLDPLDQHFITIDWGDGQTEDVALHVSERSFAAEHTYAAGPAPPAIQVTVTDEYGASHTVTASEKIADPSPVGNPGGPYAGTEGDAIALDAAASSDPDGQIVEYRWDFNNDGAYDDAVGPTPVFVPLQDGTHAIGLWVLDDSGRWDTTFTQITVVNAAPSVSAGPDQAVAAGAAFAAAGSFADPGNDTWNATVDYGDGSGVQPLTLNADKTFALSHVYAHGGIYLVTVTVADGDGGVGSDALTISVGEVVQLPGRRRGGWSVLLRRNGPNIELVNKANTRQRFFSAPDGSIPGLTIRGLENRADTLTVDYSRGSMAPLQDGVLWDGGSGSGRDTLVVRGTAADDAFALLPDRVVLDGIPFQFSAVEQVLMAGLAGNDTYAVSAVTARTTIRDSRGTDTLDFSGSAGGVSVNLAAAYPQRIYGGASTLAIQGVLETLIGTAWADAMVGNSAANHIFGGAGSDTIRGGSGNDVIYGGPGDDWLYGGAGHDSLFGESGNNVLLGGAGNDILDVLTGADETGKNLLIAGLGADTLQGGPGEEILIGGTTRYDSKAAALAAIVQEWFSDAAFVQRCRHLIDGIVDPGNPKNTRRLTPKSKTDRSGTVLDDRSADQLFGGPRSDWFFDFAKDAVRDRTVPEDR